MSLAYGRGFHVYQAGELRVICSCGSCGDQDPLLRLPSMRRQTDCAFVFFVLPWVMAALKNHTVLPPSADDHSHLLALQEMLAEYEDVAISTPDGSVLLSESVRMVLADAVTALVHGQAVTVEPQQTILTTQEAAQRLGISRPTLVRLLEQGKIPYITPGRHRRVQLADVLAFQDRERERRGQVLREMAREETPDPDAAADGFIETR